MNDLAIYILFVFQFMIFLLGLIYLFFKCKNLEDRNDSLNSSLSYERNRMSMFDLELSHRRNSFDEFKDEIKNKMQILNDLLSSESKNNTGNIVSLETDLQDLKEEIDQLSFVTIDQLQECLYKQRQEILEELALLKNEKDEKRWENLAKALSAPPINQRGIKQ